MKTKAQLVAYIIMLTPVIGLANLQDYINDSADKGVIIEHIEAPETTHLKVNEQDRALALVYVHDNGYTEIVDVVTENNDFRNEVFKAVKNWQFSPKDEKYLVKIPFVVRNKK